MEAEPTFGWCIYIDTLTGTSPALRGENGMPFVFASRAEAEREIVDNLMTRLHEYLAGEREFEDAITIEEYVVDVDVWPDGTISDEQGNEFRPDGG